ncbi:ABC transporter ATP-binding protein [Halostagnicola bangensis]
MTAIETTTLTKRYDGSTAVNNLELTVQKEEVYGFLGPNGAGKSTTIDILMDYTRPTEGNATVLGMDVRQEASAIHAKTGILPDQFGVYSSLTGREHVEYILDANDTTGNPETTLDRVGLDDAADKRAGSYSKGMRQRLGLAMAIAGDPELLILDEPFSGLDPYGVRLVREVVTDERDRGATVFFSSHVLDQVERICDRVGLLAGGQLIAEGSPTELREMAGVETALRIETDADTTAIKAIRDLDGVEHVSHEDEYVVVTCPRTARYRVLETLDRTEATIQSFAVEEGTIEDAFVTMNDARSNSLDR